MADFKKADLKLTYSWTAAVQNDNAKITGVPDSTLLSRNEGYEVLPFLNRYMTAKSWKLQSTLHNLEDTLRSRLPSDVRSHSNVKKWLDINFKI